MVSGCEFSFRGLREVSERINAIYRARNGEFGMLGFD